MGGMLLLAALVSLGDATLDQAPHAPGQQCVLPVADGGDSEPSHPNIEGALAKVEGAIITVERKNGQGEMLQLTRATEIFTVYGGRVAAKELLPGQKVRAWYEGCRSPSPPNRARLAVLMLASTSPVDDWP